ncbi:MAG TPA: NHL repeat-containing protein, partial [Candidatus Binataceae bacterium]|nr:NHL repeat-containing protein [Candidatus Binataceae bacterium]
MVSLNSFPPCSKHSSRGDIQPSSERTRMLRANGWENLRWNKRSLIVSAGLLFLLSAPRLSWAQTSVTFLTSGTQWTVPNNWNNANNTVEVMGSGGKSPAGHAGGSGGGSYSRISNLSLTSGNHITYQIGSSGGGVTTGGATWFNGTSVSNASVSAEGGCSATSNSGCSNSTSSNVGTVIYAGGKGGNGAASGFYYDYGGGGGAGGPHGAGAQGTNATSSIGGLGGAGGNGFGGAGGTNSLFGLDEGTAGGAGTEFSAVGGATAGSGGGGGGGTAFYGSGAGGGYGGGGGGTISGGTPAAGGNGLIVITYAPNPDIFVTNLGYSTGITPPVTAYPLGSSGNAAPLPSPAPSPATGLSWPYGIARDSSGNLYVANELAPSLTVYARSASGNAAPTATIAGSNTGLTNPTGIALDSSGNIYEADAGSITGGNDSVNVYAAGSNGNVTPAATITGTSTGLANPTGIALDSSGNIYVPNSNSVWGGTDSITVYPAGSNGNATPSATIAGAGTGLLVPWAIALDSSGNIYVANQGSQVWAADSITVYSAGSNGNATPSATISGTSTGLLSPGGIAVDSSGNIYVTNDAGLFGYSDSITVYTAGSNGNVVPSNTLFALGLAAPAGIV